MEFQTKPMSAPLSRSASNKSIKFERANSGAIQTRELDETEVHQKLLTNSAVQKLASMFGKKVTKTSEKTKTFKPPKSADLSKFIKPMQADYGIKLKRLREFQEEREKDFELEEESLQKLAIAKVKGFMNAITIIVKLQAWLRMIVLRRKFLEVRKEYAATRKLVFLAWKKYSAAQQLRLHNVLGKPFFAWKDEVEDVKRLNTFISAFFKASINKLKLTPQSVMCFFNREKIAQNIEESDINKIRRLILQKIFQGWVLEVRNYKAQYFRASQIIARMVRRTKGVLYSKEATLVCFHMWKRYVAVKLAYKRDEPDPTFYEPLILQWSSLYQSIIVNRMRKRRAAEMGSQLVEMRAFRVWRKMMILMKEGTFLTPAQRADVHYASFLCKSVLFEWHNVIRGRGKTMRLREKCFKAWAKFAPLNKRMRFNTKTVKEYTYLARLRSAFNFIKNTCFHVIGKRTTSLKVLRQHICNRKVLICAYALANYDSHVIFLDCWRRWQKYWRARWRWKILSREYSYLWYQTKVKVVFGAWRMYSAACKKERLATKLDHSSRSTLLHLTGEFGSNSPLFSGARVNAAVTVDIEEDLPDPVEGVSFAFEHPLIRGFTFNALDLCERALRNLVMTRLDGDCFALFCRSVVRSLHLKKLRRKQIQHNVSYPLNPGDKIPEGFTTLEIQELQLLPPVTSSDSSELQKWNDVQLKLENALDSFDLVAAVTALESGAEIQPEHIRSVMQRVGDDNIPILALLLTCSKEYMAERCVRHDKNAELMYCHSPLSAYLVSTHVERYIRQEITGREMSMLTQGCDVPNTIAGKGYSQIMWRLAVLMIFKKKADDLQQTCKILNESRSVDEEVTEVLKRQKISKYRSNRESMRKLFGINFDPFGNDVEDLPALIRQPLMTKPGRARNFGGWAKGLDLYGILKEFTFLTGKLAVEAQGLRKPMLERDDALIKKGLVKQFTADFSALRRQCLTEEEIENEEYAADKLKKQQEILQRKKLAAQVKKFGDGEGHEFDNFSYLLASRNDDDLIIEETDYFNELVFQQRASGIRDVLLETWSPFAEGYKDEKITSTLIMRRRKEALQIFGRLLRSFSDLGNGHGDVAASKVPYLPEQTFVTEIGYGGYVLLLIMKHLYPSEFQHATIQINSYYSETDVHEWSTHMLKSLCKWIPIEWWNLRRVHEMLNSEIHNFNRLSISYEVKAKEMKVLNSQINKQKLVHQQYLTEARADFVAITKKARKYMQTDYFAIDRRKSNIEKIEKEIAKAQSVVNENHSVVLKCEVFISSQNYRGLLEMQGISFDTNAKTEDLRFRAYNQVEELRAKLDQLKGKVFELESKKRTVVNELNSMEDVGMQAKGMLNKLASERFKEIMDVQDLVDKGLKDSRINDESRVHLLQSRTIIRCYLNIMYRFRSLLFIRHQSKPKEVVEVKAPGGKKKRGTIAKTVVEEESDHEDELLAHEDVQMVLEDGVIDDGERDDCSRTTVTGDVDDDKSNVVSSIDQDEDDEESDSVSLDTKGEAENDEVLGTIGFGSGEVQRLLKEETFFVHERRSSLSEEERKRIEKEALEQEMAKKEEMAKEEMRLRVMSEYWQAMGEEKKAKTASTENMGLEEAVPITKALFEIVEESEKGTDQFDFLQIKGVGRTKRMWEIARKKSSRNVKHKSSYVDEVDLPKEESKQESGVTSHLMNYMKDLEASGFKDGAESMKPMIWQEASSAAGKPIVTSTQVASGIALPVMASKHVGKVNLMGPTGHLNDDDEENGDEEVGSFSASIFLGRGSISARKQSVSARSPSINSPGSRNTSFNGRSPSIRGSVNLSSPARNPSISEGNGTGLLKSKRKLKEMRSNANANALNAMTELAATVSMEDSFSQTGIVLSPSFHVSRRYQEGQEPTEQEVEEEVIIAGPNKNLNLDDNFTILEGDENEEEDDEPDVKPLVLEPSLTVITESGDDFDKVKEKDDVVNETTEAIIAEEVDNFDYLKSIELAPPSRAPSEKQLNGYSGLLDLEENSGGDEGKLARRAGIIPRKASNSPGGSVHSTPRKAEGSPFTSPSSSRQSSLNDTFNAETLLSKHREFASPRVNIGKSQFTPGKAPETSLVNSLDTIRQKDGAVKETGLVSHLEPIGTNPEVNGGENVVTNELERSQSLKKLSSRASSCSSLHMQDSINSSIPRDSPGVSPVSFTSLSTTDIPLDAQLFQPIIPHDDLLCNSAAGSVMNDDLSLDNISILKQIKAKPTEHIAQRGKNGEWELVEVEKAAPNPIGSYKAKKKKNEHEKAKPPNLEIGSITAYSIKPLQSIQTVKPMVQIEPQAATDAKKDIGKSKTLLEMLKLEEPSEMLWKVFPSDFKTKSNAIVELKASEVSRVKKGKLQDPVGPKKPDISLDELVKTSLKVIDEMPRSDENSSRQSSSSISLFFPEDYSYLQSYNNSQAGSLAGSRKNSLTQLPTNFEESMKVYQDKLMVVGRANSLLNMDINSGVNSAAISRKNSFPSLGSFPQLFEDIQLFEEEDKSQGAYGLDIIEKRLLRSLEPVQAPLSPVVGTKVWSKAMRENAMKRSQDYLHAKQNLDPVVRESMNSSAHLRKSQKMVDIGSVKVEDREKSIFPVEGSAFRALTTQIPVFQELSDDDDETNMIPVLHDLSAEEIKLGLSDNKIMWKEKKKLKKRVVKKKVGVEGKYSVSDIALASTGKEKISYPPIIDDSLPATREGELVEEAEIAVDSELIAQLEVRQLLATAPADENVDMAYNTIMKYYSSYETEGYVPADSPNNLSDHIQLSSLRSDTSFNDSVGFSTGVNKESVSRPNSKGPMWHSHVTSMLSEMAAKEKEIPPTVVLVPAESIKIGSALLSPRPSSEGKHLGFSTEKPIAIPQNIDESDERESIVEKNLTLQDYFQNPDFTLVQSIKVSRESRESKDIVKESREMRRYTPSRSAGRSAQSRLHSALDDDDEMEIEEEMRMLLAGTNNTVAKLFPKIENKSGKKAERGKKVSQGKLPSLMGFSESMPALSFINQENGIAGRPVLENRYKVGGSVELKPNKTYKRYS